MTPYQLFLYCVAIGCGLLAASPFVGGAFLLGIVVRGWVRHMSEEEKSTEDEENA